MIGSWFVNGCKWHVYDATCFTQASLQRHQWHYDTGARGIWGWGMQRTNVGTTHQWHPTRYTAMICVSWLPCHVVSSTCREIIRLMEQLCLAVTKASSLSKNHFSPQRATMTLPRCLLPAYQISRFSNKSDNDVHCGLCLYFLLWSIRIFRQDMARHWANCWMKDATTLKRSLTAWLLRDQCKHADSQRVERAATGNQQMWHSNTARMRTWHCGVCERSLTSTCNCCCMRWYCPRQGQLSDNQVTLSWMALLLCDHIWPWSVNVTAPDAFSLRIQSEEISLWRWSTSLWWWLAQCMLQLCSAGRLTKSYKSLQT